METQGPYDTATMPYENLQEFLRALEAAGELRRIKAQVDPVLEVAEITDRVSKASDRDGNYPGTFVRNTEFDFKKSGAVNQGLLFENVAGSGMPLSINTFGSFKRMHMAAGVRFF